MTLEARKGKATKEKLSSKERWKELWGCRKGMEKSRKHREAEKYDSISNSYPSFSAGKKQTFVIMSFQSYRGIWYKSICPI